MVTYSVTGSQALHRARVSLALKQWVHSSLIFTKSGDLRVVINGKKILHSKREDHVAEKTKIVNLIIGSWSKLGSSEGPKLQFDEIAVFFQELDVASIRKIVLKDYGKCKNWRSYRVVGKASATLCRLALGNANSDRQMVQSLF